MSSCWYKFSHVVYWCHPGCLESQHHSLKQQSRASVRLFEIYFNCSFEEPRVLLNNNSSYNKCLRLRIVCNIIKRTATLVSISEPIGCIRSLNSGRQRCSLWGQTLLFLGFRWRQISVSDFLLRMPLAVNSAIREWSWSWETTSTSGSFHK